MTLNSKGIRILDKYACYVLCVALQLVLPLRLFLRRLLGIIPPDSQSPSKILLIKFPGIGNLVMLLPTVRALRVHFDQSEILFLTLRQNAGLMESVPDVDRVLYLDTTSAFHFAVSLLRLFWHLSVERVDMVLDFEQFAKTASVFSALTAAPYRYGFETPGQMRGFVYTHPVDYPENRHMVPAFAAIAQAAGVPCENLEPVAIPYKAEEARRVERLLADQGIGQEGRIVLIHAGSGENFAERRWPENSFAQLADRLAAECGARVVFTGTRAENALIERIRNKMEASSASVAGKINLTELAALTDRAYLVLSNDTALAHFGCAMSTPVAGFYGPNTPVLYGPWGGEQHTAFYHRLPCSPCITNLNQKTSSCQFPVCIWSISVQEVFDTLKARYFSDEPREEPGQGLDTNWQEELSMAVPEHGKCHLCGSAQVRMYYPLQQRRYPYFFGELYRCADCGLMQRRLMEGSERALLSFYNDRTYFEQGQLHRYGQDYRRRLSRKEIALYRRALWEMLKYRQKGRILEVGSGMGIFLDMAKGAGWAEPCGVEISRHAAEYAMEQFGVDVHCGTLQDVPHADASFDVVVFWDTLDHLPDPFTDLRTAYRLLRPGGLLLVVAQNAESLLMRVARMIYLGSFHFFDRYVYDLYDNSHTYFFGLQSLKQLFQNEGLQVVQVVGEDADPSKRWDKPGSLNKVTRAGIAAVNQTARWLGGQYRIGVYGQKPEAAELNG
ncbi:MAG: methyltransferase domain-containing protein [Candidatus Omnitrophica bacterium]|nr:methyltransferase domain-containing protein [Candidatus Omnitrophota bacterium]